MIFVIKIVIYGTEEANCNAGLSHSKQLMKNYSSSDASVILSTDKKPAKWPTVHTCNN